MNCQCREVLRMFKKASNNMPLDVFVDRDRMRLRARNEVDISKYLDVKKHSIIARSVKTKETTYFPYQVELDSILLYLREENYIERVTGVRDTYRLKQKGIHNIQYAFSRLSWDFIIPALVSVIGTIVMNWLSGRR